jgi:hypothetical protein
VIQGGRRGGVRRDVNIARDMTVRMVIRERQTGKKVVGWAYHVSSIVTIDYEDDVYAHEWQVGNLAAWSNCLLIHTAMSTRQGERKTAREDMRSHDEDALMAWKGAGSMSSLTSDSLTS